ncbi:PH domain-containing protein [Risungbinella massiliensis]|uniref:PH domain-containing protein n=1 Tax=Risungbinella massiliensis TaxID=1329796 RepID=UPI0005CBD724|nr:PH domain-containing protein [Risungbinella massiliensis]
MFGKVAADVLGLSDIGSVIKPENYDKVDADDYVMHEDGEKIFFLIKSKSDEYCFTNKALVHLDGTSAMSKKRVLRRFDYYRSNIQDILLETAGTVDMDVELKFTLGNAQYSIDVHKKHLEEVKDLYKALLKLAEIKRDNQLALEDAKASIGVAASSVGTIRNTEADIVEQFKAINQFTFDWNQQAKQKYRVKDFGFVFEKYINN